MEALSALGFGAFVLASLVVGVRLLRLGARTGELPELAIGLSFLMGGVLSYGLFFCGNALYAGQPGLATSFNLAGLAALGCGGASQCVASWRIYRPDSRNAAALCAAWIGVILACVVFAIAGSLEASESDRAFWSSIGVAGAAFGWTSFEAFRLHGVLRLRVPLGLAEPEVAHRFLLWGVASASALFISQSSVAFRVVTGEGQLPPWMWTAQSIAGLVSAVTVWLAFFPPQLYRHWVSARAEG